VVVEAWVVEAWALETEVASVSLVDRWAGTSVKWDAPKSRMTLRTAQSTSPG